MGLANVGILVDTTYIRIERKGNVVHAAILFGSKVSIACGKQDCRRSIMLAVTTHFELLLKLVSSITDAFARGLDVVDTDADVSEAFAMVFVAIGDLEVGVALGAVVVR
jgi:hypothetical protein